MKTTAFNNRQQQPFWDVATTLGRDKARLSNIVPAKYVVGEQHVHTDAYVKRGKAVRIMRSTVKYVGSGVHKDRSQVSASRKGWTL